MFFMLSFILHSSFNVCLFVSIQFRDKIVLIVIYKSLTSNIRCDWSGDTSDDSIDFIDLISVVIL
jgi:hypothetical protein